MKKDFLKGKAGRVLYWGLIGVLAAVFLLAAFMIARHFYEAEKSEGQFEELAFLTQQTEPETEATEEKAPTAAEKYATVLAQNEDFVGWIKIEGTRIDYPVVQSLYEANYYLRRGFDKKYSYYGVPYASEICDIETADNITVYGHNMTNGSMFSDLGKYRSEEFWKEHRYIQFDTLSGYGTYEILAVIKTVAGAETEFEYYKFTDGNETEFAEFIAQCKARSLYETGVTAEKGDRLLTLSTCEYSNKNGRLAVIAKKIT